jgi:hypothetical protein
MRKRLSDPALRDDLRAETLAQIRSGYPQIAEELGLDPELEARLFEVLTDQQMAHLESFYRESPDPQREGDPARDSMQQLADEQTRAKQQILDVLGEARFEHYLGYMDTRGERLQVVFFEGQLEQRDRLTPDQRQRLMALLRAEEDRHAARQIAEWHLKSDSHDGDDSPESMQKLNVALNEDNYRLMLEDSRALLARLPAILTPSQLDAYARMEASKLASQRSYVEELRAGAQVTSNFDDAQPRTLPARRTPATGKVRLELTLTIDAHPPVMADVVTENGRAPPAIQCPEGLWVEATPALYEDGWAQVDFTYYEERGGKRIRLRDRVSTGYLTRDPQSGLLGGGGGGSTLGGGRKSFAVSTWIVVTPTK